MVDYVGSDKRHLHLAWVGSGWAEKVFDTGHILHSGTERRCPRFSWPSALFWYNVVL